MIVHFSIIAFLLAIFFLVVLFFFFPDSLPEVFLDMSGFVAVMEFWYACTLFMTSVFYFVPVFTASGADNLVLVFHREGFFILF